MDNNKPEVETENSVSNSDSTNLEPKVENSVEVRNNNVDHMFLLLFYCV